MPRTDTVVGVQLDSRATSVKRWRHQTVDAALEGESPIVLQRAG